MRQFIPSPQQEAFFKFVAESKKSCNLISVAGSGKSTSIVRSLPYAHWSLDIAILAFNAKIVEEMRAKVRELGEELGKPFANVKVQSFHSLGFGVLAQALRSRNVRMGKPDDRKCWNLFKKMVSQEDFVKYSRFVCDLVAYAKGSGIGILNTNSIEDAYYGLVDHHDMQLDSEEAELPRAISLARELMKQSFIACRDRGEIDFDDMLFMPLALKAVFPKKDLIYGDEMQDTNPVRREIIKRSLKPNGRLIAVGDPKQAIYGFTGATNDAMDIIAEEFNCETLYLNVSYRCPKAIVDSVQRIVPYFNVHEGNAEGDEFHLDNLKELLENVQDTDAILCRNIAPMVSLAFKIIGAGRPCHVLGSEIGKGLVKLIHKMECQTFEHLGERLNNHRAMECERLISLQKEKQADQLNDKVECIFVLMESVHEPSRSIPGQCINALIQLINSLFKDETEATLTLSSMHRAKGREWTNVVIYRPDLCPSPWARQGWQRQQEKNLEYVAKTRTMNILMTLDEVK